MSTDNNTGDEALRERLLRAMHRNGDWMTVGQILAFVKAELSRAGVEIAELQALEMNHEGACVRLKRENDELRAQLAAIESASWKTNIDNLRSLEDGWDSYGGKKPRKAALEVAEFIHAAPMSNGGIQIDFGCDRSVEISPEGVLSCEGCEVLRDRLAAAEAARAKDAAELERMRAENQELSDQSITNAQRLGSVCDSWHNWAVEIVGKEAARRMSGQDMRDEIARRLAGRTTDQAEPRKRRGPGPDGPPKAGDPQDADKDGAR